MKDETLRDINFSDCIDNKGNLKASAIKLKLVQNSIYLRESIRKNNLFVQDFTKEQKKAIIKFIAWYYD